MSGGRDRLICTWVGALPAWVYVGLHTPRLPPGDLSPTGGLPYWVGCDPWCEKQKCHAAERESNFEVLAQLAAGFPSLPSPCLLVFSRLSDLRYDTGTSSKARGSGEEASKSPSPTVPPPEFYSHPLAQTAHGGFRWGLFPIVWSKLDCGCLVQ